MQQQYGGLNPLDGPAYWQGLNANNQQKMSAVRQDAPPQWVNVDGTLYPVQPGSQDAQYGQYGQESEQDNREAMRALLKAQRKEEFTKRQGQIMTDLESAATATEAYGLGGLVPLSSLGVDATTGARAAGLTPVNAVLPATPDAWRVRAMPSGQASVAPTPAPTSGVGDLLGNLKPLEGNKYAYQAPAWAK